MVRRLYTNHLVTGWVGGMVSGRAGNQDLSFSSSPSLSFRQKSSEEGGESPLVIWMQSVLDWMMVRCAAEKEERVNAVDNITTFIRFRKTEFSVPGKNQVKQSKVFWFWNQKRIWMCFLFLWRTVIECEGSRQYIGQRQTHQKNISRVLLYWSL